MLTIIGVILIVWWLWNDLEEATNDDRIRQFWRMANEFSKSKRFYTVDAEERSDVDYLISMWVELVEDQLILCETRNVPAVPRQ